MRYKVFFKTTHGNVHWAYENSPEDVVKLVERQGIQNMQSLWVRTEYQEFGHPQNEVCYVEFKRRHHGDRRE